MRMRLASLMALVSGGKINFFSGDDAAAVATSGSASAVCKQRSAVSITKSIDEFAVQWLLEVKSQKWK